MLVRNDHPCLRVGRHSVKNQSDGDWLEWENRSCRHAPGGDYAGNEIKRGEI
jgi:hypothetical protein